jgi:hypothetical protein
MVNDSERITKAILAFIPRAEQDRDLLGGIQPYIEEARQCGLLQSDLIARRVLDAYPDSRLAERIANKIYGKVRF